MATSTSTKTEETKKTVVINNAMVKSMKQMVMDEENKPIRGMYYITIATEKGVLTINTGEKNYEKLKEMLSGK